MPCGDKGGKASLCCSMGHFLRSGLREEVGELRRFLAILRGMQPGFSATQTAWRSAQSRANPSPLGEFTQSQRPLRAESSGAKAFEMIWRCVLRSVNDAKVIPSSALHRRLHETASVPGDELERLHYHTEKKKYTAQLHTKPVRHLRGRFTCH